MKTRFLIVFLFGYSLFGASQEVVQKNFYQIDSQSPSHLFTTSLERQKIFELASQNPVASLEVESKYDPTGEIGFCFGRAMAVHLIARNLGVETTSIRKLFVIGKLQQYEETPWRFHVTTIVLGQDHRWYAIDPIMTPPLSHGLPQPMHEWMRVVQETWDKEHKARFYVTSSNAVLPDIRQMVEIENETGKEIIELAFDPEEKPGFLRRKNVYLLSSEAEKTYFIDVKEEKPQDEFSFLGISVNQHLYDFNNYFVELLESLVRK